MNCGFRGAGPISWNPLQAAKQRSCGYVRHPIPFIYSSPKGDWPMSIVGPALRNQEKVSGCLSHSCAPSELAVGFWWIRVPSGHGADWAFCYGRMQANEVISAMGGCVATARRHSLLCLLRQLVALIQQVAIRFRCSFSATLWKPVLHVFMSKIHVLHVFMSKIPVLHVFMSKIHVFLSAMQISYKE